MKQRLPYATRNLKNFITSVYPLLLDDRYIDMTESQFVSEVMKNSGGSLNPKTIISVYNSLMCDAGLEPLYENHK
jgi:hypothetical protein